MSAVVVLLSWLRPTSTVEDMRIRRLDGIRGHRLELAAPRVPVFSVPRRRAVSR